MIPVVTLPPPVVLATTDESAPDNVRLPPILTAEHTTAAFTSISNSYVMEPEDVINWIALIPTQRCVKQL